MTRRRAAVLAIALGVAGCGGSDALGQAVLATRIDVIEAEIRTRIGPAACLVDEDCRALPLGALACGGPSGYVPYSIRGTDEGALSRLSADHQRLSAEQVAQQGRFGTCVAVPVPTAYCERSAPLSCRLR